MWDWRARGQRPLGIRQSFARPLFKKFTLLPCRVADRCRYDARMDFSLAPITERVRAAAADQTPLRIRGGGTKDFHGLALHGEVLDTRVLRGIVSYEPSELVVTVRAGTLLAELEAVLAEQGQCLPFEPPHFAKTPAAAATEVPDGTDLVEAPFGGSVWKLLVAAGDAVKAGDTIAVIEAMKMECPVESPGTGTIEALYIKEKQSLQPGSPMLALRRTV